MTRTAGARIGCQRQSRFWGLGCPKIYHEAEDTLVNFCMMAVTLTWIYADRLKADPERRHKVKGRTSFAFSDVRRIIAEAALDENFARVCPKPGNPPGNSLVTVLLRMVA
ncbi:hypothetical protein [Thiolapillus sp.]|uniref:hypothetical protein n=1 Tax=Thiolapillus sp. TaxID=2017437 RepID=UPI003AF66A43